MILLLRRAHHANDVLLPKTIRTIVLTTTVRIPTASPTGHAPRVRRASMLLPVSPKWNYRDLIVQPNCRVRTFIQEMTGKPDCHAVAVFHWAILTASTRARPPPTRSGTVRHHPQRLPRRNRRRARGEPRSAVGARTCSSRRRASATSSPPARELRVRCMILPALVMPCSVAILLQYQLVKAAAAAAQCSVAQMQCWMLCLYWLQPRQHKSRQRASRTSGRLKQDDI